MGGLIGTPTSIALVYFAVGLGLTAITLHFQKDISNLELVCALFGWPMLMLFHVVALAFVMFGSSNEACDCERCTAPVPEAIDVEDALVRYTDRTSRRAGALIVVENENGGRTVIVVRNAEDIGSNDRVSASLAAAFHAIPRSPEEL